MERLGKLGTLLLQARQQISGLTEGYLFHGAFLCTGTDEHANTLLLNTIKMAIGGKGGFWPASQGTGRQQEISN